ncbi:MAG: DUF1015 domain-containing protein [Sphingobacteriales bacterium]|nr:DUF1015 domain-containing protein [Sphingobacteriales bacterium]
MPKIKPFKAILPSTAFVREVVISLENLSIESAKEIRGKNPHSFVHLLVPKIENYYLMGSKQELAFKKISENLEDFLQNKVLVKDHEEAIYIYQQTSPKHQYTGFWTVSSIDDYLSNQIKKHELTRAERERGLIEYVKETGLDANPVLITYPTQTDLEDIINQKTKEQPDLDFELDGVHHQIWKINQPEEVKRVVDIFENMPVSYIADGHHRAAAASTFGIERRKLNLKHQGAEEYNFFSSVYISTNQLDILAFHRFIKLNEDIHTKEILEFIKDKFNIKLIERNQILPQSEHVLGFYMDAQAYQIQLKSYLKEDILTDLDVSILQNEILEPLFQITNPREDKRMHFIGGEINVTKQLELIDQGVYDLAFFLFPIAVSDLIKIADIGETMPPKSTWFEPKFLAGLVTHEIN